MDSTIDQFVLLHFIRGIIIILFPPLHNGTSKAESLGTYLSLIINIINIINLNFFS